MKLMFLDFDGVLNNSTFLTKVRMPGEQSASPEEAAHVARLDEHFPQDQPDTWLFRLRHIDPEKVRLAARIVNTAGAKVVISSSWRKVAPPAALGAMLACLGFPEDVVIGETRHNLGEKADQRYEPRGHYIRAFLEEFEKTNEEVTHFVVLDDDDRMAMVQHRFVRTDFEIGLTDDHARRALMHLGVDP